MTTRTSRSTEGQAEATHPHSEKTLKFSAPKPKYLEFLPDVSDISGEKMKLGHWHCNTYGMGAVSVRLQQG